MARPPSRLVLGRMTGRYRRQSPLLRRAACRPSPPPTADWAIPPIGKVAWLGERQPRADGATACPVRRSRDAMEPSLLRLDADHVHRAEDNQAPDARVSS